VKGDEKEQNKVRQDAVERKHCKVWIRKISTEN
jgi:hypothetical protein